MHRFPQSKHKNSYTVEQVFDYMECPLCYHLKHEKKLPLPENYLATNKNVAYQEAMQETFRYFYIEHQKKKPPSYKKLCDKFYQLFLKKTDRLDTVSILTRKLENATRDARNEGTRFEREGLENLKKFYDYNRNTKQAILAVNHPYRIQLKGSDIIGHFDVVREIMNPETKLREIQIVNFQMGRVTPDAQALKTNVDLLTMGLGFRKVFGIVPDRFLVYYPVLDEEYDVQHELNDYRKTINILNGFRLGVENIPPYPRPGAHPAIAPYKEYCDNYTFN